MREILFRGKRIDDGEWEYGSLIRFADSTCEILVPENDISLRACTVIEESCGQYTGLTDKNGTRIFEWDIVNYNGTNHVVVFETRCSCGYFGIVMSEIETWSFGNSVPADLMVVIGNIHDNPELLERSAT